MSDAGKTIAVKGDDFRGQATHDAGEMMVTVTGVADYAAVDALEELLDGAHQEAVRAQLKHVAIDLRQLEFMNSSCFKCLVSWITLLQDLPAGSQYRITFLSNPQMHWQRRSLHSLRCFAEDLITVTES